MKRVVVGVVLFFVLVLLAGCRTTAGPATEGSAAYPHVSEAPASAAATQPQPTTPRVVPTAAVASTAVVVSTAVVPTAAPTAAVPTAVAPTVVVVAPPATVVGQDIPRIAVEDLWQRLQGGEAVVIVDARGVEEYKMSHIAGAISMPEKDVPQRAGELPKDSLIVFYCT